MAEIRNILNIEPRPLFFTSEKIVLSWSPKSACSHAVVWFFVKEGLLRAANYYDGWPHNFRAEVYYRSAAYKAAAAKFLAAEAAGYTLVKVTRDPAKRLVSIFRHVCRHTFLRDDLTRELGFDVAREGLSLVDFDRYLAGKRLVVPSEVNFHLCAQYHPVWDMAFDRVVTINMDQTDLNAGLNRVEAEFGLPHTDFKAVPKFDGLRRLHYARDVAWAGPEPVEAHRFLPAETAEFPKTALEAAPLLHEMARRLYAIDYDRVAAGDVTRQPAAALGSPA
jgi:hypothetical protein